MDIKASDLRIGNLVMHFEIGEIRTVGRSCAFKLPTRTVRVDVKDLSGIPLTEELLLRFGCCKINEDIFIYNRFKLIWKKNYKYWYVISVNNDTYLTKIEFVHEFQNFIYVMNGDEIKLKNPPVKDQEG